MRNLHEFASALTAAKRERKVTANDLAEKTGLSPQAVRQALAGVTAPRLTNAMALAQELGYELVLVPVEVAQSLGQAAQAERTVLSDVERLLGEAAPARK